MAAVNARFVGLRVSGMERYAREITVRMGALRLRLVAPRVGLTGLCGQLWEQTVLPHRMSPNEVLWNPANTGPIAYHPQVVTVHDAAVFDHPEWFRGRVRLAYRAIVARLIHDADLIATPSEFTRARLIARFSIDSSRVRVVRAGVSAGWLWPAVASVDDPIVSQSLARVAVRRFGLAIGGNDPRKNLDRLVAAWEQVRRVDKGLELVVLGSPSAAVFTGRALANQRWIHFIRNVSDSQLDGLYRAAEVLVYPSLYEGCGLPPLEALARGTAVVVSDIPVLRETLGGVACFVNPWDAGSIAGGVVEVVGRMAQSEPMERARRDLARFPTWEQAAEQMVEVLEDASGRHWR